MSARLEVVATPRPPDVPDACKLALYNLVAQLDRELVQLPTADERRAVKLRLMEHLECRESSMALAARSAAPQ